MSGLILTETGCLGEGWAPALSFSARTVSQQASWAGFEVGVTRVDALSQWGVARDAHTGTAVALGGRLNIAAQEWALAEGLPYSGSLAGKLVLHYWLTRREQFEAWLDGPYCILIHEPLSGKLHVFTDRMGVYPLYQAEQGPFMLCSHPDVLADQLAAVGVSHELDWLTMAECLAHGTGVHPYTYYQGIRQLDPATHYVFKPGGASAPEKTVYWSPLSQENGGLSENEWAEELASALRSSGARRGVAPSRNVGLLLSGGADSRALLYAMAEPARVEALTFCDEENAEVAVARQIADAVGARHRVLLRDPEHYARGAWETVRISGGMWSVKDAHYHGFMDTLESLGCDSLVTGCYTDYLLKGLAYNRKPWSIAGKNLPLDKMTGFDYSFYQPQGKLAPNWRARVMRRQEERFPGEYRSTYDADPAPVADLRVRPLSREADAMGRLFLMRTLPWDPMMVDNAILRFYAELPPRLKLNARVFRKAVARLTPPSARNIPNNNDDSPLDAGELSRAWHHLAKKIREKRLEKLAAGSRKNGLATAGSWPNFVYYIAHSPVIAELWANPSPAQKEILGTLLGFDPWSCTQAEWARRDEDQFLRALTLKIWLAQRGY